MSDLLTADTNRDAWLAARRKGIGASEIAAVLGISPWESPFSLWWRKVQGWDYEPSAEMEWGTRLEEAIATKYMDAHPDYAVCPGHLEHHPIHDWMMATPDRYIWDRPRVEVSGLVELKTAHSADGWGEPGTADVPVYYKAQVLWQMAVIGVEWADVAVLIGGSDYREYHIPYDRADVDVMYEAGRRFMHRIETGDPPPIDDHQATLAAVKRLHPDLDDETVEVDASIAEGYRRAVAMEFKAKRLKQRYEIRLREAMGSAHRAESGGRKVATRVITEVEGYQVGAHTKDYLLPPRERKPKP